MLMRRKLPKYLDRYHLLHERAEKPRKGHSKRVRMQRERKRNVLHAKINKRLQGGKRYTPQEFVNFLKGRNN